MLKEFPILEFDVDREAVIDPQKILKRIDMPECVILCFFTDVLERLKKDGRLKLITNLRSEMGMHPLYEMQYSGRNVTICHPGVGAPLAAVFMEELVALGGRKFIACGGAGVLDKTITVGQVIIPYAAIRDEGTSYHYLPASREVHVNHEAVTTIQRVLKSHECQYLLAKTWTTDAVYRETINKVNLRRREGCLTVEMECSALCAVAQFRSVIFGQILYGGDDVSCEEWDPRYRHNRASIRQGVFEFAVEACLELKSP